MDYYTGKDYGPGQGMGYTAVMPRDGFQYKYGEDGTRYSVPIDLSTQLPNQLPGFGLEEKSLIQPVAPLTDQEIRDAGLKYIPKQKYLMDPYILPTEEEIIPDSGIVNTDAFANSGGGDEPYIIPKDEEKKSTGPYVSPFDAAKQVGMFMMGGPQAYIMQKLISKGIGAFKDYRNKNKVEKYTGQEMSSYRDDRPSSEKNYTGGDTNSNPSTPGAQDSFSNKSGMGRTGYFFGGRVNYKAGGRINFRGGGMDMGNEKNQAQSAAMGNTTVSNNNDDGGGSQNINVTKEIQKAIEKKIPKTEDAPLMSDKIKKYFTLSNNNRNIDSRPFLRNPKKTKNLYTNNLTNLNIKYPNIDIKDEYGYIQGDKAKSLIDRAIAEGTISPVEGLNLTRSIDTTGTQSNTSGNYTMGNFNFNSPNIEEGILNSGVNYNLGDLNLNANLNTNDSTINDSRLGFNYGDGALTGSTFRDNDYGYTTNKLGVDKTFDVGNNFKVGLDGSYQEDKFNDGSYYNADLTPSLTYNDGTFNANLSKEIVEGGTQPNLGIGFQKNGFYANANNLLSQDPTGTIGYQKNIGSPDGPLQFSAGGEMDPFTGQKTAGLYGKYTFKNGGLAGLI